MRGPVSETMSCMEVWGGNRSTWSHFVVPGLDLWVYSQPYGTGNLGGDVYYVSSCASGRITRLFLGDVSGHGAEAAPLAGKLREILRKNVNYINQSRVVECLNAEFEAASSIGHFATAIVSTYFAPTQTLSLCTAGHPPPLLYRASKNSWQLLKADRDAVSNLPFGISEGHTFTATKQRMSTGDMFLGYSDALFESRDSTGKQLSAQGLVDICTSLDSTSPGDFVQLLLRTIRELNPANLVSDDATVILARVNQQRVGLKNNLLAPFRFLSHWFSG